MTESQGKKPHKTQQKASTKQNRTGAVPVKSDQAGLLWRLLNKTTRQRVAKNLTLSELDELNRAYKEYASRTPQQRRRVELDLLEDTRPGFSFWPITLFLVLGLLFVGVFFAHLTQLPSMSAKTRFYVFAPFALGVCAPLFSYLIPAYRLRMLFRPNLKPETLGLTFLAYLGLMWTLFFIGIEHLPSFTYRPKGLTFFVLLFGSATAPYMEEVFFREVFPSIFGKAPHYLGHFLAACLFALAHLPGGPYMFTLYVMAGLFLSLVRVQSNSLLFPLLIHSLANLTHQLLF